jgi:tetratricopeptide (TPR) repeat protein
MSRMASQAVPKLVKEGRQRHRAGDIAGALDCYKRFLRKKPQQVDVLLLAAMAAAQINETQLAEQLARRAARYRPDAKSFITLGRVLVQQESWDEAIGVLRKAAMDQQVGIDARFQLGQALARLGRTSEAEQQFTELLGDAPEHAPAWNELGLLQMGQDRPDEAVVSFGASLRHRPNDAGTLANLGAAYLVTGRPAEAEESVVAALSAEPGQLDALRTLGLLCKDQGRLSEATEAFEKLIQQSASDASAWSGLAAVLQAKGEMEASEKAYEKSLTIDPGHVAALAGRAEWLEWQGRYQDGLASLDDAVAELSGPGVAVVRARLLRRLDRAEEGRTLLKSVLETTTGNVELRKQILFSLGDACDATKRYDEAFDYYTEGNRLSAAAYDRDAHSHMLARQNSLAPGPGRGPTGEQMIFVLGMPRSGTTLVEQILSAHPDVYAAGELSILGRLGVSAMDGQGAISAERAIEMGQSYLSELPAGARSAFRTTDKMPLNFLYLGLMQAALPGARVIHCRRDPRDVALSCYFIDFIDPTLGFSARLEWLGDYINSYLEQMDKWRETLALPMLEVDYEALVDDPEHWSRRLVDFAGLEWNPACLSFHDQNRVAATASHAQVRKPVYRSSVGRWRHYESHLAPLLQAMERKE